MTAGSSDRRRAVSLPVFGVMVMVLAAFGAAGWLRRPSVPEPQVVRFTHPAPSEGAVTEMEVSPDGSVVLFQLSPDDATWIRRLDENEARRLPSRGFLPRFSPTGDEMVTIERSTPSAFIITPVDGGPVRRPTNSIEVHPDYLWGADGYFYMSGIPGGMVRFREQDQVVDTLLTDSDGWPEALLPDGSALASSERGCTGVHAADDVVQRAPDRSPSVSGGGSRSRSFRPSSVPSDSTRARTCVRAVRRTPGCQRSMRRWSELRCAGRRALIDCAAWDRWDQGRTKHGGWSASSASAKSRATIFARR
jgi:hypothetical protein